MLDRQILQGRGLRNVEENGHVTGFQFDVRNPNYRGVAGSLLDGIEVIVDGEKFDDQTPIWSLQGRTLTLDELRRSTDLRWNLDEVATITVPKPGGLATGVHHFDLCIYLRRSYFPPEMERSAFRSSGKGVIVPAVPAGGLRFGVSTYSYSTDIYTSMTLEDAMADIADIGASGFEILGEGNVPGYPKPPAAWIDNWFVMLDRYGLTPTNFGSWVDTTMWRDRNLTAAEGAAQIQLDLRLASKLGFTSIRPKFGVTSFDLVPHPIWEESVERSLDLAAKLNLVICPEIHSPTPIRHPVTQAYIDFIERTGSEHFRLLIDTGIFQTAPVDDGHDGVEEKGKKRPTFLEPLAVPMSDLREVLKYVYFFQTKFFEINDDLVDLHVPWQEILDVLMESGWSGWLSSEYEGRREPYRGRDQVRRQHALMRSLLVQP